ncbi:Segregation and condensation protein A [Pandoraea pulmonicola]|uniref:Segregation and condensation protein A n=1 Tax=Pandoraea pulmonicola TaxID=93221 RepID=A0AAJ5CZN4_PANPU|nr:Segregation and condensation protein A [Pandoraea pulmonicola]
MNPTTPDDPSHLPEPIPEIEPVPPHVDALPDDGTADAADFGRGAPPSEDAAYASQDGGVSGDASGGDVSGDASGETSGKASDGGTPDEGSTGDAAHGPSAAAAPGAARVRHAPPASDGGTTELPTPQDGQDSTPDTVDGVARARLYGEPLFALPNDLYIPPDALEIFLEAFEGPLDLLLYLIRKQNFNVLDIPMAQVTKQYLLYVDQIRRTNLELASEYLLMAAMLIEIKSRMLLPVKKADTGEEAEDPRAELVRRLLEYEQMKLAAQKLDTLPVLGRDFLRSQVYIEQSLQPRFPDVDAEDLRAAWAEVLRRAKLVQHHKISREELSVREHMSQILRRLQGARFMEFTELFDVTRGVPVVVVNFIAMLELSRESLLEITQAEPFAPIYVRLTYSPN